jgi:hypothetical protein
LVKKNRNLKQERITGAIANVIPFMLSQIYLSIFGSTALFDPGRFFSFLICTQSVRLLGRGISPSQGR